VQIGRAREAYAVEAFITHMLRENFQRSLDKSMGFVEVIDQGHAGNIPV
jgi:hypothetical protein